MKNVHVVLQGKGGVGKSLVAALLCQYFRDNQIKRIYDDVQTSKQGTQRVDLREPETSERES